MPKRRHYNVSNPLAASKLDSVEPAGKLCISLYEIANWIPLESVFSGEITQAYEKELRGIFEDGIFHRIQGVLPRVWLTLPNNYPILVHAIKFSDKAIFDASTWMVGYGTPRGFDLSLQTRPQRVEGVPGPQW